MPLGRPQPQARSRRVPTGSTAAPTPSYPRPRHRFQSAGRCRRRRGDLGRWRL